MKAIVTIAVALAIAAASSAVAKAEGNTSGPAAGTPVEPSTVVEKQNPHFWGVEKKSGESGTSAGAPGIEGAPDTQSGPAPKTQK